MESKLAEFRAHRSRQLRDDNIDSAIGLNRLYPLFNRSESQCNKMVNNNQEYVEADGSISEKANVLTTEKSGVTTDDQQQPSDTKSQAGQKCGILFWSRLVLLSLLWLVLWALFIELEFGAVYFVVSTSVILYLTMRPGSRDQSKLSAYSVFNPNFERLDGTFTAEQFERELRFGAGSVRPDNNS